MSDIVDRNLRGDRVRNPQVSVADQVARGAAFKAQRDLAQLIADLPDLPIEAVEVPSDGGSNVQADLDARPTFTALAASSGTSLSGFIQSGADAIPRTAQDKLRDVVNAADYGVSAAATASANATALQNAFDYCAANNVGRLTFPFGEILIDGDVILDPYVDDLTGLTVNQIILDGQGCGQNGTWLHFTSGGLKIRSPNHFLANFVVTSDDGDGIAIEPTTAATIRYAVRAGMLNVRAEDCSGSGFTFADTWIYTMANCFGRRNGKWGLEGKSGANFSMSCNGLTLIGGEFQANGTIEGTPTGSGGSARGSGGGILTGPAVQVVLNGVSIEGNVGDGLKLSERMRGLSVIGCYFEKNGSHPDNCDICNDQPGLSPNRPNSVFILNCNFTAQDVNGTNQVRSMDFYDIGDLKIVNPQIYGSASVAYTASPIRLRETSAGLATGWVEGGMYLYSGYTQAWIDNQTARYGFPRRHIFSPNHVMTASDTTADNRSAPFVVPMAASNGRRIEANITIGPGTWDTGVASGGATGVARIVTEIHRGMAGALFSTKTDDIDIVQNATAQFKLNNTSISNLPGTFVLVTVSRSGDATEDVNTGSITLLTLEIVTYEGRVAAV